MLMSQSRNPNIKRSRKMTSSLRKRRKVMRKSRMRSDEEVVIIMTTHHSFFLPSVRGVFSSSFSTLALGLRGVRSLRSTTIRWEM